MTRKQRIVIQRALTREALGKLHAAAEWFGAETEYGRSGADLQEWMAKVHEIENWFEQSSPIA